MSQISKATQSSESDTDFIQDNTINSVYGDSLGSENDTVKRGCPVRMRLILEVESERCYIMATTNIEHDHSKCTRKKNNKSQRHRIHRIHRPLLNLTNRMI